jgi:hypothetical protein
MSASFGRWLCDRGKAVDRCWQPIPADAPASAVDFGPPVSPVRQSGDEGLRQR